MMCAPANDVYRHGRRARVCNCINRALQRTTQFCGGEARCDAEDDSRPEQLYSNLGYTQFYGGDTVAVNALVMPNPVHPWRLNDTAADRGSIFTSRQSSRMWGGGAEEEEDSA
jgi:hypothetical protein